ncbi:MAG: hypothetical protein M3R45_02090 [Pseudomonadota bacterium]|nr:hypothetical protein [Pseudomonadota bacterium]
MNWLKKIPQSHRAATGLEWRLWRKLPLIALLGTVLLLLGLALVHLWADPQAGAAEERWLQMVNYMVGGAIVFHWSMVATVGIGCVIVMVMKGPGYVADGYRVSHSDQPRKTMETAEEASGYRLPETGEPDMGRSTAE